MIYRKWLRRAVAAILLLESLFWLHGGFDAVGRNVVRGVMEYPFVAGAAVLTIAALAAVRKSRITTI